ncbi:hypothetical protein J1605_014695 [Eschrichtius robustus]|uniref:Uncharacterized protein n=1 Tax=Eschrichtius robustus TaxID=9764 RepID=A0AB34GDB1_ESCRO|nr:hypothetical protein J1605_014695 [Eschrichtius robustus]
MPSLSPRGVSKSSLWSLSPGTIEE